MENNKPSYAPGGYREVLNIAYPLIMSTASMTIMHFVDRVFLARYAKEAIAASVPAGITSFTIICTIICLFMGISGYTNAIVAQHYGAGEYKKCSLATWQGIIFSLISYIPILLFIPLGPTIFALAGHSPEIQTLEVSYYTILMWGGLFVPLHSAVASFFTGRGDTKTTMVASIIGNGVNVVLDYGLIFGRLGLPEMGIEGAAIATVISSVIPVAILFFLFLGKKYHKQYQSRATMRFDRGLFMKLLKFGSPSGIQFTLDIGAFTFFIMLVGRIGEVELAVSNMALSINMLAFLPMIGISIATTTLVGQYIGKEDISSAEKSTYSSLKVALLYMGGMALLFVLFPEQLSTYSSLKVALLYMGGMALLFVLFPEQLLSIFKSSEDRVEDFAIIIAYGRRILILVALYSVFDAMNIIFSGALKGAGDTRFAMWAAIIVAWVFFVPPVYLIIEVFEKGVLMAWGWATLYIILIGSVFCWRFRKGKWKEIDLLGRREKTATIPPVIDEHLPHDQPLP
ncbi:MAG: MATE family efflux transporter [Deltaproteobacteria bacterium]|nr:MATE family efflux transporter [Deltaproteobacteria bacterium]